MARMRQLNLMVIACAALFGAANAPADELHLLPGELAFGDVPVGQTKPMTLTLYNASDSTLSVHDVGGGAMGGAFNCADWWGPIPSHESHEIIVTFTPTATTEYLSTLWVHLDDHTAASVKCWGTGVPPLASALRFTSPTYSVAENGESVRIYVSRTGDSSGAASVNYATANDTATAGSDFTAVESGMLSWSSGDSTDKHFDVSITNDSSYEDDETFTVILSDPSGATLGSPSETTVTIVDDDPSPPRGSLRFTSRTYSVVESGGSVRIGVSRIGGSFGLAAVNYHTDNGTATADSDYTEKFGTLGWSNGDSEDQYFDVSITNDSIDESDETFTVRLTDESGATLGSPSEATVTIVDDDDTQFTLLFSAGEGGQVTKPLVPKGAQWGFRYDPGDSVPIAATPNTGYRFVNWTGTALGMVADPTEASTTVTVTDGGSITANFAKIQQDWSFVHITDLHVGYGKCAERLAVAVDSILRRPPKPKFVLVTGDIVECAWFELRVHPISLLPLEIPIRWASGFYQEYLDTIALLKEKDIGVYEVPGNHDRYVYVGEPSVDGLVEFALDGPFYSDTLAQYQAAGLSTSRNFPSSDFTFIGLDSGQDVGSGDPFKWFAGRGDYYRSTGLTGEGVNTVRSSSGLKIVFMHSPAVNTDGWTISSHQDDFVRVCKDNGVELVLTGHTHKDLVLTADGNSASQNANALPAYPLFIQTPSLTKDTGTGYRVINVHEGHAYPGSVVSVPGATIMTTSLTCFSSSASSANSNLTTSSVLLHTMGSGGDWTRERGSLRIQSDPPDPETTPPAEEVLTMRIMQVSPASLHVYDSLGRQAGRDSMSTIPHSFYFRKHIVTLDDGTVLETSPEKIIIIDPCDDYTFEVVGEDAGSYELNVANGGAAFRASAIPATQGQTDQYTIDWTALSRGEEGVVLRRDVNVDGEFEKTVLSGHVLTGAEVTSLVAKWCFDERGGTTARDSAGKHDATVVGADWVEGLLAGALHFDGIDDYVDCADANDLAPANMTISLWIRGETSGKDMDLLGKATAPDGYHDYIILLKPDFTLRFLMGDSSTGATLESVNPIAVEEWTQVVATKDDSAVCLYVNGKIEASASCYWVSIPNTARSLQIGACGSSPAGFFRGDIDDVRIYNKALSTQEVQTLYEESLE